MSTKKELWYFNSFLISLFSYQAGVQGICRTHYIIIDDPRTQHIKVDKLRDLNHCQERIMKDIGLVYTEKCVECQAVSAPLPFLFSGLVYTAGVTSYL